MDRRKFVTFAGVGCSLIALPALARPGDVNGNAKSISFYVAGVRFYSARKKLLAGNPVNVTREIFKGKNPRFKLCWRAVWMFLPIMWRPCVD